MSKSNERVQQNKLVCTVWFLRLLVQDLHKIIPHRLKGQIVDYFESDIKSSPFCSRIASYLGQNDTAETQKLDTKNLHFSTTHLWKILENARSTSVRTTCAAEAHDFTASSGVAAQIADKFTETREKEVIVEERSGKEATQL